MFSLFLLFTYLFLPTAYSGTCEVSIQNDKYGDLKNPQPLILTENGRKFFYPDRDTGVLKLSTGQSIYVACLGNDNFIKDKPGLKQVEATCEGDKKFRLDGTDRTFSSLICRVHLTATNQRLQQLCLNRYHSIGIGFQLNNWFLQTIEVCRNEDTYETYYTKFTLTKNHGSAQMGYPRPNKWTDGNYFDKLNMERLYNWNVQIDIIGNILQSSDIAKKLINQKQFLSRGHLAAKGDFVYGSQQDATFSYLNAAPQWVTFNSGNWLHLEQSVQNFTRNRYLDFEVYTGVHGQMTMADGTGRQRNIQLTEAGESKSLIVPKFFWKIIYDPLSKRGTAFVGLNDPFIPSITESIYLCEDKLTSKIKWLHWYPTDIKKGVSYACPIHMLRKQIPTIPALNAIGVLI